MAALILEMLQGAWRTFFRHRLRSGLCVLSLVMGIGAIVTILAIEDGARAALRAQVLTMGDNVITVLPGTLQIGSVRAKRGSMQSLTMADAVSFKREIPHIKAVCGMRQLPAQAVWGNTNWRTYVIGMNAGCIDVRGWTFLSGGLMEPLEWDEASAVVVLGKTVADALLSGEEEAVGSVVLIKGVPFRVIGVLAPKGDDLDGDDQDNVALVPFATAERRLYKSRVADVVDWIMASAHDRDQLPDIVEHMRRLLRERRGLEGQAPDPFTIGTQVEVEAVQQGITWTLNRMLSVLAALSVFVGGLGIMNILLVSVTERTREIGVRMAVGAKRRHILMQFLIEAMTLSLVGGMLGTLFGVVGPRLTTVIAGWPTIISGDTVLAAFVFSLAVGLFFGLYPANKAARLNPIDALRYE